MSIFLVKSQKLNYLIHFSSRLSIPGSGVPAGDSLRTGLLCAGWPHAGRQGERGGERSSDAHQAPGASLLPLREAKDVLRWWSPHALPRLWRERGGDCECLFGVVRSIISRLMSSFFKTYFFKKILKLSLVFLLRLTIDRRRGGDWLLHLADFAVVMYSSQ